VGAWGRKFAIGVAVVFGLFVSQVPLALGAEEPAPEELQVSSLAEELEVPEVKAEEILETQQQAPGIVEQLEAVQGSRYAGVWFDDESGKFVVPLLASAPRASVESLIEGAELEPSEARIASATYSWEELEKAQTDLDKMLDSLIRANLVQTGLDPVRNSVVVSVAGDTGESDRASIRQAAAAVAVAVRVEQVSVPRFSAAPAACSAEHDCDKPLRGGVWIESNDQMANCSAGFRAIGKIYGNHFVLTAGHCGANKKYWNAYPSTGGSQYLGEIEEDSFPGNDWGKIRVSGGYWEEAGWPASVVYWGGDQNLPISYESASYVGESVCHSGGGTGSSCGVVTSIDQTANYSAGAVYGLTEVQGWCGYEGDSGGPVWNGETALGLFSGMVLQPPCGAGVGYYSEVTEADEAMGVTVGARVNVPPAVTTGSGSEVHPQPREAVVGGVVDPNGLQANYHFDYGLSAGYGSSSAGTNMSAGWQPQRAEATLTGLAPATLYHYRLVGGSGAGTGYGSDQTFSTPPVPPIAGVSGAAAVSGTSVALKGFVGPENSATTWYFEYGTTAAYGSRTAEKQLPATMSTEQVSVVLSGLSFGGAYHYRLVAQNAGGVSRSADRLFSTGWLPSAVPRRNQSNESILRDVSCLSKTWCYAVGVEGGMVPLAATWNGSEWEVGILPHPGEASASDLRSVSCAASTVCEAVGYQLPASHPGQLLPMALGRNGGDWIVQAPPTPEGMSQGAFSATACPTTSACEAVGWMAGADSRKVPLAERWSGSSWVAQNAALPSGATIGRLESISCFSSGACVAVGVSETAGGFRGVFAERWNGSSWTAETLPVPTGATEVSEANVSCWSASACEAAGTFKDSSGWGTPFAERWNGASWQVQALPVLEGDDAGEVAGEVSDLACASASSCELVGRMVERKHGAVGDYLAEAWDGSRWIVQEPARPAGGNAGTLEGVSCAGSTACVASGQITGSEGVNQAVAAAETYFSVPPAAVVTKSATEVGGSGATLRGTINPNGLASETYFEYGPTNAYGSKTAVTSAGAGLAPIEETAAISGLNAGSEYHFRIVGINTGGTTYGKDSSFRTPTPALATLPVTDPFNGTASAISNFKERWTVLPWAGGSSPKGEDRAGGWGPVAAFPNVAGASYGPTVTDLGSGIAVEATVQAPPGVAERHFSIWLDMPASPTTRAGYQLKFYATSGSEYTVSLISWSGGTPTLLGETANIALTGDGGPRSVALMDEGATVSAWIDRGAGFTSLLSAADSTYSGGTVAVEGSGNGTRLTNLRFGVPQAKVAGMSAALNGLRLDDAFATAESPLSEGGTWAPLSWDYASSFRTGQVSGTTMGWAPYDPWPNANGAYWTKSTFADTGSGDAITATARAWPKAAEEHFELLLDMPNPGGTRSGYELRLTGCRGQGLTLCDVKLEKYVAGSPTVLATGSLKLGPGGRLALVDKGGIVSVWTSTSGSTEYAQLLSVADATFTGGYIGVSGAGTVVRLQELKGGPPAPF
jgi:hypothetical protein